MYIHAENWVNIFDPNDIVIFFQNFLTKIEESFQNAS